MRVFDGIACASSWLGVKLLVLCGEIYQDGLVHLGAVHALGGDFSIVFSRLLQLDKKP